MITGSLRREEQDLVEAVSAAALMESTRAIAQWVRLSGTPDEANAFDWIEGKLRKIGLETARHSHPGLVSWPESATLTLIAGGAPHTIPCGTHGFAASTPAGGLEGDVVYAGRGSEDELSARRHPGKDRPDRWDRGAQPQPHRGGRRGGGLDLDRRQPPARTHPVPRLGARPRRRRPGFFPARLRYRSSRAKAPASRRCSKGAGCGRVSTRACTVDGSLCRASRVTCARRVTVTVRMPKRSSC